MVIRPHGRGLGALLAFVFGCMLVSAPGAYAYGGNPPGPTSGPSAGSSSGSSGAPVHQTVKTCSLYASSSGFGLSCITGGGAGNAKTVREILGAKESLPTCWDDVISDSDLVSQYGYTPNPDAPYYLHTCITGIDETRSPADQPDAQINQIVIEIPAGSKPCFNYDEAHDVATPFTAEQLGTCVMTLTGAQQQVVSGTASDNAQIPGIIIAPHPSTRVRTNEDVEYVDAANTKGNDPRRTPNLTVGGVTLWATMDAYKIYPYGPDGLSKNCDGTLPAAATDTRESKPDACWWKYPRSSADQPGLTYPFRAEADWTVHYSAGGVDHVLASFQKYADLALKVFDVQTLVVR